MSNYQSITILGRSGKDGELRTTQNGKEVCSFSVAVTNWDKTTSWYECSVFGKQAESYASKFLKKGSVVLVTGEPSINTYEKNDGTTQASIQIMVKDMSIINTERDTSTQDAGYKKAKEAAASIPEDIVDEIPFTKSL